MSLHKAVGGPVWGGRERLDGAEVMHKKQEKISWESLEERQLDVKGWGKTRPSLRSS